MLGPILGTDIELYTCIIRNTYFTTNTNTTLMHIGSTADTQHKLLSELEQSLIVN